MTSDFEPRFSLVASPKKSPAIKTILRYSLRLLLRPMFPKGTRPVDFVNPEKKMRSVHTIVVLALTIFGAGVANAAQQCRPVVGSFEATVQPADTCAGALCTAGRVWGGIQGNYRFTADKFIPNGEPEVPSILFFTGHSIINLKSGDQLFGTDTGSIDLPPGKGGFASLITFTGGTGAMTNATGQIRLRGELNPADGTTSGDYLGELCTPQ